MYFKIITCLLMLGFSPLGIADTGEASVFKSLTTTVGFSTWVCFDIQDSILLDAVSAARIEAQAVCQISEKKVVLNPEFEPEVEVLSAEGSCWGGGFATARVSIEFSCEEDVATNEELNTSRGM